MAAADLSRGSKGPASNSGGTASRNAAKVPQRIRSMVVTIETPTGYELPEDNQSKPYAHEVMLVQGVSQLSISAATNTTGTDKTGTGSALWCEACMADELLTSCISFPRNKVAFILIGTDNLYSLLATCVYGLVEPRRSCGKERGSR